MFSNAQTFPLRTYTDIPKNAYVKHTMNELPAFEGFWRGEWKNKVSVIKFSKIKRYNEVLKYYQDVLVGRFSVTNATGTILFDNFGLSDENVKIIGVNFGKQDNVYVLNYSDSSLCSKIGTVYLNFTNNERTELFFRYVDWDDIIEPDCFYHGYPADRIPEPLPKEIVLSKQVLDIRANEAK